MASLNTRIPFPIMDLIAPVKKWVPVAGLFPIMFLYVTYARTKTHRPWKFPSYTTDKAFFLPRV